MGRFWDRFSSWEEAERAWDVQEEDLCTNQPAVPGVMNRRFLRLRALWWVLKKDRRFSILRRLFRKPWRYANGYLRSLFRRPPYTRIDDIYCFGVDGVADILKLMEEKNTILVVGFSYCQKPKDCPSVRFSDQCIADPNNPTCRRCFVGKCMHALPSTRTVFTVIPTINAIGEVIMQVVDENADHKIIFLITACEMAIEMFGDFSNMVGCKGVGVRLQGRFCNTWRAFQLSEEGIKPGVTTISQSTQRKMLALLRYWRECHNSKGGEDRGHNAISKLCENGWH